MDKTKHRQKKSSLETLLQVLLQGNGIVSGYEDTKLGYSIHSTYYPDFHIKKLGPYKDIYLEAKGHFSSQDRKKMRAVHEQHPKLILIMVFGKANNKLNAKSKTTYAQWCDKIGIPYCDIKDLQGDVKKCLLSTIQKSMTGKSKTPVKKNSKQSSS